MPPLNPEIIRCLTDTVTQVRNERGQLVGCVPKLVNDPAMVTTASGKTFETRFAVALCVYVAAGDDPQLLDGFVWVDRANADLALPLTTTGDDPDIGQGV